QSAGYLLAVIDKLNPEDSGGFFAWDGQSIEY
ncbi:MAG: short-chain dehydrogenase, partial [Gammaproteobacteria bacterium]|nr:short-chain dehydrogenase [Gammaproteobacteria bacterium]